MSHSSRATRPPASSEGRMRNVSRSGRSTMSDSSIRTKPSIAEPSKRISPPRAFSNWLSGTSTFLLTPKMSVNCRRRNATPCSRQRLRMSFFVAPVVFSIVAVMAREAAGASRPPHSLALYVVVQEELVRMGPQRDRVDLLGPLVAQPRLDEVVGKDAPLEQERVVRLERRQRFAERARGVLHVLALLRLELVQIHVHRLGRLDLVLHAVQPRHEQGREREGGISGRIGGSD